MSGHTPGPWALSPNFLQFGGTGNDGSVAVVSEVFGICDVRLTKHFPRGKTYKALDEQRDANARLIAASPELLEAAQKLMDDLAVSRPSFADGALMVNLRRAITKATAP